ncbi:class I SAM-dependent methyltransferase [Sphingosinicella rhizophila]|uniref:Class I SAM-dependent methyltransferase n=1 Tax=Sphingosinicella rhizophila TaxID=3050082 RepID=A0ABU3QAR1_9SPHN|nr:class I SAM-dependent methyltransferase [Sphingosinicella sp. GR2756]MDT9600495.1 class I SAM-dependent methyltransferase [Sphingosinicella sp. GR2756]
MAIEHEAVPDQATLWNGHAGHVWVEAQEMIGRLFKPIEEPLVEAIIENRGREVLDIGCGTGGTTRAMARHLGSDGHCTGVDISAPMIDAARARTREQGLSATFLLADAQRHDFGRAVFDTILSRFGVMFFDDPVQAFANLRRAAKAGALLRFVAWRDPAENPFMTTAERAAAPFLPDMPKRAPDAPGQFAFADRDRVRRLISQSGWERIEIQPADFSCSLPESELDHYFTRFGPLGILLGEADEATRNRIVAAVRPAFSPFVHGDEVRFTAACWMISARSPSIAED